MRIALSRFTQQASRLSSRQTGCLTQFPATSSQTTLFSRDLNVAARPSDLVGHTPLLDLTSILKKHDVDNGCVLYGKMESMEPCSSVKDRLGRSMIDAAEATGQLVPGKSVLVEPTSGNTGIALAFIARERGYRCILTMPETMSIERRMMLLALGAEVVLTPKETAVPGALAKAHEIIDSLNGDGVMLQQFENPANPKVHRETTGPEIWEDTDGTIDLFVSGVGTGGTVTGVSQFIKGSNEHGLEAKNPNLVTIGVEPQEQMLLTAAKGGEKIGDQGPHKIQGMGAGLVPQVLDLDLIDEVVPVHSEKAMETTQELWNMGIPVGVSSGAIVNAAIQVCGRDESKDKVAVCIIPSFGERYFTHPMFDPVKEQAECLTKQPLPPPYDNRDFGFATERGDADNSNGTDSFFHVEFNTTATESMAESSPTHLIFGANTDVGKTVLTAGLLRAASQSSHSTHHYTSGLVTTNYIKPLQCGGSDEGWILRNAPNVSTSKTLFRWETPASPHVAARMENYPVSDEEVMSSLQLYMDSLDSDSQFSSTWIETAGGVMSPSSSSPKNDTPLHAKDSSGWGWKTQGDLYMTLQDQASVVLVGDGRLGGISVTLASLEALLRRNYVVAGVLLLRNGEDDYAEDVNQRALQEYLSSTTSRLNLPANALQSPLFTDPDVSVVSLPKLPPEPEPLTEWYETQEVEEPLGKFVHDHLFSRWR